MSDHISSQWLAYIEGRLLADERARVASHLASCAACRAEIESLRDLADVLSIAPRALNALASRRALDWSAVRAKLVGLPPGRDDRGVASSHWRAAFGLALVVVMVMISTSLFISPAQATAVTASGPALAVIQTPAALTGLTDTPGDATLAASVNSTATLALDHPQTPAPIPTGRQP